MENIKIHQMYGGKSGEMLLLAAARSSGARGQVGTGQGRCTHGQRQSFSTLHLLSLTGGA